MAEHRNMRVHRPKNEVKGYLTMYVSIGILTMVHIIQKQNIWEFCQGLVSVWKFLIPEVEPISKASPSLVVWHNTTKVNLGTKIWSTTNL